MAEKWWIPTGPDKLAVADSIIDVQYQEQNGHMRTDLFNSLIGREVKIRIIINTSKVQIKEGGEIIRTEMRSAEVWRGDLEILEDNEYLTKISIIGDGQEHPICDIPFALGTGWWMWVPQSIPQDDEEPDDE